MGDGLTAADLSTASLAALGPLRLGGAARDANAALDVIGSSFERTLQAEVDRVPEPAGLELTKVPTSTSQQAVAAKQAKRIDKAAKDFEGLLLYTLLKQMWATVPRSAFFDSGLSTQFYREMYLDEVAKRVAEGGGIGIAQAVQRELTDWAARTAIPADLAK